MAQQSLPFVIIGGGIGGLACALALSRKGFKSILLEQASEFGEIGAGIQLGPNVFRMFEKLGIADRVKALAVFPEMLMMRDAITAEVVTKIDLDERFLNRFKYPYAVIHRADLHTALVEACREHPDFITMKTGQKVTEIDDKGSHVTVRTATGETLDGAALIGADGLWSVVRQKIVGDGAPVKSGHITYRAVLPTSEVPEDLRTWGMIVWAGEKTHLVQYPMRGGELFNLVAVFHSNKFSEGWDSYGDPVELHERFAQTCQPVRTLLGKIESWRMWVLCDRPPIRDWSKGNITLLGDAAHPMLQYLAQGACMAIEDAVCIARKLELSNGNWAQAFLDYQKERYLRTARVQLTARLYGEAYHASNAVRDLRNATLSARTQAESMESVAWLYDPPPIGD
jgi:2-polyprenyl-6-methoxyphenol hydroxylase-like FAD-dependent oxidoreductase